MADAAAGIVPPEVWIKWEKQGKYTFLKLVKESGKTSADREKCYRLIYSLLSKAASGSIKTEGLKETVVEIISLIDDAPAIILDTLYALDAEIGDLSEVDDEQRQGLYKVIKEIEKCVPEALLKERLEIKTLLTVGTLKNNNFRTKLIRIKTKLYFKQKKFNLLREESEGYAKLITELSQEEGEGLTSANIWEATKSLIGCFNLDPNRVIDLLLEALEIRQDGVEVFIEVLRNFADVQSAISEILGFKLVHFHRTKEPTPRSLYLLVSLLLQRGLIDLEELYPWLMPLDAEIEKDWQILMNKHKNIAKKINSLQISKDKDEPEVDTETPREKFLKNQKFGLCEALLSAGAWSIACNIINRLPARCVVSQPPVSKALCSLIHHVIEPLYASCGALSSKIKRTPARPVSSPIAPKPVKTLLDLRNDAIPMIIRLGSSMHVDPILLYKVIRISRVALEKIPGGEIKHPPEEDSLYYDVLSLLDVAILPSLSYLENNCGVAEEIWTLLKHYPYWHRYALYSRWKNDNLNDDAVVIQKNAEALKFVKNLMKRVSKENIKPVGRMLGKVTHACPGYLFDYILIQLQTFENLIEPVVDSLKFLTNLSYDVLGFCIVDTLAKASLDKSRSKFDGSTVSNWLQALASFCGAVFKKYSIDLVGLLQFVANQLKEKNPLDLLIVREVVVKMAGIEASEEMTNDQLNALSGGEVLKAEAGYYCQVRNTKKSSQRLKDALNEYDLGPTLCLLMAQQRHGVVYKHEASAHVKHVARLYDQCQDTLVQYGTFLGSNLSVEEYKSKFPSVSAMMSEYHIQSDVAFFLARPTLNHAINQKYEALIKSEANYPKLTVATKQAKYMEAVKVVTGPLIESIMPLQPANVWNEISPQFFVTFWSLSIYDMQVPTDVYVREINKLKKLGLQTLDSKEMPAAKIKKETERINTLMDKLQEEQNKQKEHVAKVLERLKHEKARWFLSKNILTVRSDALVHFLQLCVFPRCLFTASDAVYCAKFILTMHALRTENFPTVLCLDRLFCDVSYTLTMCTENEAHRYGRFLCTMLETMMRWHGSVSVFNEECLNTVGFETRFRVSRKDGGNQITYDTYRDLCHKWHYRLTRAFMNCLDSQDFNQIRNALVVLIKILPYFPKVSRLAVSLSKGVDKIREEEKTKRPDLYLLATSYFFQLKGKAPDFCREAEFHNVAPPKVPEPEKKDVKEAKAESNDVIVVENEKKPEKREREKSDKNERKGDVKPKKDESPRERDRDRERSERDKEKEREREKKEAHRERARERKEERALKDERYPEDERYAPSSSRDERYSGGTVRPGYYESSPAYFDDSHNLSEVSNSPTHSLENVETDRDVKRRKVESSSSKVHRGSPDWVEPVSSSTSPKTEKKDRGSRTKDKLLKKERKSSRKRERHPEEGSPPRESPKIRKEESLKPQNGSAESLEPPHRTKREYSRDRTPVYGEDGRPPPLDRSRERERIERVHDKPLREKHRRPDTVKRR